MKKIFEILNLEETKDAQKIKMAYRTRLTTVHPEEDPEGFKALRSAYEKALAWAAEPEESAPLQQSPTDVWLTQVEAVYQSFSKRISPPEWQRLLADDLCVGLDTFHETREKLMGFLMNCFRLPFEIWQLIDQSFHIVEDKADLGERYPENFLNYVLESIAHAWLLDFNLFAGDDDGDYDGYIAKYHQLKAVVDEGKESPDEVLAELRSYLVYHPYTDVEEARYYLQNDRAEEAYQQLVALHEAHPQDAYILYYLGRAKWQTEDFTGAFQIYESLLSDNPKHFSARLGSGDYYLKIGEFAKAKDIFIDLLDLDNQSRELREKVQLANNSLIREFEAEIAAGTAGADDKLELGWCYLQNEAYEETLALLKTLDAEERKHFHYHNLLGRTYLCLDQQQEALPCILSWIEDIKALAEGPDEETQKRKERLGYAHYAAATCFSRLSEEDAELAPKALEYFELAARLEKNANQRLSYLQTQAGYLLKLKRYQKSIEICEQIIAERKDYFSAYLIRQECCYELEYYQNVIDDYYRCLDIYPHHPRPYILAAKTFWLHRSCEAGLKVVERSKENQIVSDDLTLHESRFLYELAQREEDMEKALQVCTALAEREGEETDLEAFGDVFHQCAVCLTELKRHEEALSAIEKALALDPSEGKYRFVKANILTELGQTDEALEIYKALDRETPENAVILSKIANLYKKIDDDGQAENYYLKAIAANPQHHTANFELMRLYKKRLKDEQKRGWFDLAIDYATRQLEVSPTAYYYIERGLIYLDLNEFAEALADFTKASELEPENMYALNNTGMVYRNQERYEEAVEYFKKAAEYAEKNESLLPYGNLGKCYESLKRNEEAFACYQENLRLFPEEPSAYKDMGLLLCAMGRFAEALTYYEQALEVPRAKREFFLLQIGDLYRFQKDWQSAEAQYKKVIAEYPKYAYGYKRLAELYIYNLGEYRKAEKCLQTILKELPKEYASDYEQFAYELGVAYYFQRKKRRAKTWLETALQIYEETFGLENYIALPSHRQSRLYLLGQIYFYLNEKEQAKRYFRMMEDCLKCHHCSYSECFELHLARGMTLELDGDPVGAKGHYEKALAIEPDNQETLLRLQLVGRK